ncbi:ESX secretion-associated protein EspG [Nocardia sp. NBC_01329]|uniref:ESX secretion-associated protein EspG n=1 Tax=Nocardia sp. NBC_01329 TaxID=2903594 RepID=UPI002E136B03|nr:ESX secretion-associated protein EspG [Nocardia sp. NBC_01329]
MNDPQWRLDGEMFTQAVRAFGRDRLPYPIRVLPLGPTETPPTFDEYEQVRLAAARRLADLADERLFRALETLLEPQVRIEVHGIYDRGFERVVRMHAGVHGKSATLAVQVPGPTKDYGGDVVLHALPAQQLTARLVTYLPRCAIGGYPTVHGARADIGKVEYSRHPTRISRTEEINRIIRRPRSGVGEIGVFAGPAIDSRPTGNPHGFHWMDYLPQDGRYLLINHTQEEFTLTPGSPEEIARRLQQAVVTVRSAAASGPGGRRDHARDDFDADDDYYRERNSRGWTT